MKDENKTKEELIKKFKEAEERLKILFDYAPNAYYISDLKGNFIDGNKAAERLTGYKREELIGKSFLKLKLLSLADIPKAAKLLVKNLRGYPTGPDEFVLNRKDNSKVVVEISTYPIKIKGKTLVLGIARDITERKKTIKEIEELAKFPAESPNPVLRISKGGTVLYHNHPSESLLKHWHYQEGKPLQGRWLQFVLDALEDDDIKTIETEIDDRVLFLTFAPIIKKDFVNVYGLDITQRKQSENTIKLQLAEITNYYKNIPIGLAVLDCDLRFLKISDILAQINGIPAEEHINKMVKEIVPDLEAQTLEITAEILRTGEPIKDIEFTGETLAEPGIKHIWMEGWYPLKDDSGKITGFSVIVQDITDRKQAEEKLSETKEYLENLIKYANAPIIVWDPSLSIARFNRAFEHLSGYQESEVIGKKIDLLFSKNKMQGALENIQKTASGERWESVEIEIQRKDNQSRIVLWNSANILDAEKNKVIATIAQGQDITERKQAEERIKHLNLVLRAIRNINQLIFEEKDRERLIKGACNILNETSGYYHSWIVLLDEKGKIDTHAEAGLEKIFLPMLKLLKKGELNTFGQIALKQKDVVIIKDPASACPDCPLVQACSNKGSVMTVRLKNGGRIYGVMSVSIPADFVTDKEEQALFMEAAGNIAMGLYSIEMRGKLDKQTHDLQQNYQKTKRAMDATIQTMSKIVEVKDPYTSGHQLRVSRLTAAIAKELNLSPDKIEGIRIASLIHDIGKISVPTEILSKSIKLSDIEFSLIKEHSQIGYDILKSIDFSYPVASVVLQHHEKIDGSGYPGGLKGDEILLEAKIICVADVVEAMSSHRPYRPTLGIDAALEEISKNKGILYEPEVVDICLKLFKEKGFKL